MKLYIVKSLENGVCIDNIRTDDFSCEDAEKMADFGEPEFNAGGLFREGAQAIAVGSANLSAGYDFSALLNKFSINPNGAGAAIVTLNAACADAAAVAAHITARLAAAGIIDVVAETEDDIHIQLATVAAGVSQTFTLAVGTPDALAVLGITAGVYNGSGENDFTLPNSLCRVKSDSPFVQRFDSRDIGLALAKIRADAWAKQILARIADVMDTLRAQTDTFSDESMITY